MIQRVLFSCGSLSLVPCLQSLIWTCIWFFPSEMPNNFRAESKYFRIKGFGPSKSELNSKILRMTANNTWSFGILGLEPKYTRASKRQGGRTRKPLSVAMALGKIWNHFVYFYWARGKGSMSCSSSLHVLFWFRVLLMWSWIIWKAEKGSLFTGKGPVCWCS